MIQTQQIDPAPVTHDSHPYRETCPRLSVKRIIRRFCFAPVLKARARRLGPHLFDALNNCSSVLDFGCGDSILTDFLKKSLPHRKVIGLDTVDSNLTNMPILIYDGKRIPFSDKSFDAVIVGFVLHHCTDIQIILEEIRRVTRKKIIILEEVYKNQFTKKLLHCHDFGNRLLSWKMEIPLNFLTLDDWKRTFDCLNLSVRNTYRIYQYPAFNLTHQIFFELAVN